MLRWCCWLAWMCSAFFNHINVAICPSVTSCLMPDQCLRQPHTAVSAPHLTALNPACHLGLGCVPQVVKALASHPKVAVWSHHWVYRHVAALLATANILGLMCANLAGFVVGVEGLPPLIHQVLGRPRMAFSVVTALFCAAHIMFAIRAREARQAAESRAGLSDVQLARGDAGARMGGGWTGAALHGRGPAPLQMHKLA